MRKELHYKELVTHVPNLINAYGLFQYQAQPSWMWSLENEILRGQCIYEFTAHLNNKEGSTTELQFGIDKMCRDFHSHLCRQLLGNNWTISKNLRKQPMLVCFFDHEGTRQRKLLERSQYPHVHGLMIIHRTSVARFMDLTIEYTNGRQHLLQKPWAFREVSFKPVFAGVEGLTRFVDYALKFDKTSEKSGNNIFTLDVYPKSNREWNTFLSEMPENDLRVYH